MESTALLFFLSTHQGFGFSFDITFKNLWEGKLVSEKINTGN